MTTRHTVQQGECLASIAAQHGVRNPEEIFRHPDNQSLSADGRTPDLLMPGDEVTIPDAKTKTFDAATEVVHKFVVPARKQTVRIILQDNKGKPREGVAYKVRLGEQREIVAEGETAKDGLVELIVPLRVRSVTLVERMGEMKFHIGHLDPLESKKGTPHASGVKSRLHNLGYAVSHGDEIDEKTRRAIRSFQKARKLEVTGEVNRELIDALSREYGC
jgi:hypothetical protein